MLLRTEAAAAMRQKCTINSVVMSCIDKTIANGTDCLIKEEFMATSSLSSATPPLGVNTHTTAPVSAFFFVKLPAALVQQARQSAQPLRRSVAGQIESWAPWATFGRSVEHSGPTVQEAQTAIEGYKAAVKKAFLASEAKSTAQADALIDRFMAVEADDSLAQRVRDVVSDNRSRAQSMKAA